LGAIGLVYVGLIVAMLAADVSFTSLAHIRDALASREIRYSMKLGLITCTITMILSVWVATPIGYLLSRSRFPGKNFVDAILDVPIVLPPLVIGLSLLILFHQTSIGRAIESVFPFTYTIAGIVLAQFTVGCAFALRAMRATFEQIDQRREQVALTLGCTRAQAFWLVTLPEARRGIVTAASLAWARSLGEFGPILVFAGATRMRTEVPATTVFLELSVGNIEAALAVSMLMITAAVVVLVLIRTLGDDPALRQIR
jgi:molybdate transport system permease protein